MSISDADRQFQFKLLHGVARTFALTIPELPPAQADVVANAYLLCRIVDTIEDEPAIPITKKCELANQFVQLLITNADASNFAQQFSALLPKQRLAAEKQLIKASARVIAITRSFTDRQQAALLRCVRIMSHGMVYYQARASSAGLQSTQQFNNYCYHVAGVVGEMLTELWCEYSPEFAANRDKLLALSISFGQALQMTNILKDIWDDYSRGVCWLPRDLFAEAGFNLDLLSKHAEAASYVAGLRQLTGLCRQHMDNAISYITLIPNNETGLRKFCLWAVGMALLTLRKIDSNPVFTSAAQVKISRASVLLVVIVSKMVHRNNYLMRLVLKFWGRKLPKQSGATVDSSHNHIEDWFNRQLVASSDIS